ncbi:MAG: hypothetical protein VYA86_04370 [Candidatus Thermoplasmatota archaeon]|nr:hypothetical protein [Candidatus Thermoplasmatota archaeon]
MTMLAYGLMNVNREALVPFFERVPDLFHSHHHSEEQDSDGYEELLYRICRPYSSHTLDLIDEWMGFERREWKSDTEREVLLFLYAVRFPDTLLIESLTEEARCDVVRLSAYLHFTKHTYAIWDEDTRKGLAKLGFDIPHTQDACPFKYGAYAASIELLKKLAPFYSFLEHDVPRQRLFQSALAAYGRES